ncbi:alkaline phosphatase D family protein [Namhaeicola litoreus]|uniref:Alkaline phosphatase D family protein n=1 Tax=Namhaeicola litoreus TaxID=1052145 RepID=A0ABW3Y618_9FLAO
MSLKNYFAIILLISVTSCTSQKNKIFDFIIAFGSCNNQFLVNNLWNEIDKHQPNIFIWGGDVIYSDTDSPEIMAKNYDILLQNESYKMFRKKYEILGTWDDHDYGQNDGGLNYPMKDQSQELFLDFLEVPDNDQRRAQKGIYFSEQYLVQDKIIKVIILDTRYFRSDLKKSSDQKKRYVPAKGGTMLGEKQWEWLANELNNSNADFHVIMSSVQVWSNQHGFETWGNMPDEVKKLDLLLSSSKAKNIILLSGDRHISEISAKNIQGMNYPVIDFTSSGMTHAYTSFTGEPNPYRLGEVVFQNSFGILQFDLDKNEVLMEIRGENNELLQSHSQSYPK